MNLKKEAIALKLLKIRHFEESLDKLFSERKIFGTYHRCIGQEATAVGFSSLLDKSKDFIVSNHRNHGHYLSFTEDYVGLFNELFGNENGVSRGLGGSQVLLAKNFLSNGIIGSTISIATGIAHGIKIKKTNGVCVCFIGDGAMGQGIVYESLNMSSIYKLPIIFILEKNNISQSTDIKDITAGNFVSRFKSFNIKTYEIRSSDVFKILKSSKNIINRVRKLQMPEAVIVEAERLCAHSKGDDYRKKYDTSKDPINFLKKEVKNYKELEKKSKDFIEKIIKKLTL
jgi:TPP-dependent pyruvate/acetoin dehydrogenase alpha subunit